MQHKNHMKLLIKRTKDQSTENPNLFVHQANQPPTVFQLNHNKKSLGHKQMPAKVINQNREDNFTEMQ